MNIYTPPSDRIVHYTYADFTGRLVPRPVHLVQYDSSLPILAVTLYNDGQPYVLPENASVNIRWHKRDNNIVYNPALGCDEYRGVVYFEMSLQMTVLEGVTEPVVEIVVDNTQVASSGSFKVIIDRNPVTQEELASASEAKAIYEYVQMAEQSAMNSAESALSSAHSEGNAAAYAAEANVSELNAKESENNAKSSEEAAAISESNAATSEASARVSSVLAAEYSNESEAWAIGTEDGVPVDPSADQYENNSKYWAGEAAKSAEEAASIVGIDIATVDKAGIVKPDGETITIDPDGTVHGATSLPDGVISNDTFAAKMDELNKALEESPGGGGGVPEDAISNDNFEDKMDEVMEAIEKGTGVNVAEEVKEKLGDTSKLPGDGTVANAIEVIEEKIDECVEYVEPETVIGKWLGKPLYRTVIKGILRGNGEFVKAPNNLERMVRCFGYYYGDGWANPIPYNFPNQNVAVYLQDNNTSIRTYAEWPSHDGKDAVLVIEYTKTTD